MTIAITGATGQLARHAIATLRARGVMPLALARDPARAADLGVPVRAFDYNAADPAALEGVKTLVLVSSSDFNDRAGQHARAIAAARAAGVRHVIYTSILKGDASPLALAADHKATETALRASGLAFTFLRNGWYSENYTGSLAPALAQGGLIGSAGTGRLSTASRADFAEAAAAVALGTGHEGKAYELAGDTSFTMDDFAAEVSAQTGKTLPYTSLPQATYAGILASVGLPQAVAEVIADADAHAAAGALFDDSRTLSRLIGRPTTPVAQTIRTALAALQA